MTFRIIFNDDVPVSPTACMICWRNPLSLRWEIKQKMTWHQCNNKLMWISVSVPGSATFLLCCWAAEHGHSPVEELVVDVLGSLHVCTHAINHLNQLLQLLLQSLHCQYTVDNILLISFQASVCEIHTWRLLLLGLVLTSVYLPRPLVYIVQLSSRTTPHFLSVKN